MIGVYWCPYATEKNYQALEDFGADLLFLDQKLGDVGGEEYCKALALCEKHNLKALVQDTRPQYRIKNTGDRDRYAEYILKESDTYTKYSSFFGYAYDEPDFDAMKLVATLREPLLKKHPDALFFVNLYAEYEHFGGISSVSYVQYLEEYCESVLLKLQGRKILSFDYYPLLDAEEFGYTIRPQFLKMIETFVSVAKKYKAETHVFLQSVNQDSLAKGLKRSITYDDLALLAYAYIAFGVDHLSHFLYFLPHAKPGSTMITDDGEETEMYFQARKLNQELKLFDEVRLPYEYRDLMPVYGKESHGRNAVLGSLGRQCGPDEILSAISDTDLLLTKLTDESGKNAFCVLNLNIADLSKKGERAFAECSIQFAKSPAELYYHGRRVRLEQGVTGGISGHTAKFRMEGDVLYVKGLEPGQGIFITEASYDEI